MAFLNDAREYHDATNELFLTLDAKHQIPHQTKLNKPLHLLYFLSIELALKAFLRTHKKFRERSVRYRPADLNFPVDSFPWPHGTRASLFILETGELYEECRFCTSARARIC